MNKIVSLLVALHLGVSLCAQDQPLVVASASMIHDMLVVIAGDMVKTDVVVPIGSDPHLYEPTPSDARLLKQADLVLVNGLTFEGWLDEVIENSGSKAQVIRVTQGVDAIASEEYQNSADPHAWMDVKNAIIYADNIRKALSEIVPSEAKVFEFNFNVYRDQLQNLHQHILSQVSQVPETQRVLITSHDAFSYYGRAYGLELHALTGVSTESDPQTSDIRRVNSIISQRQIPAIFMESTINPKLLQELAKDNNIRIGGKLYADSLGEPSGEAGTYIKMMEHNTRVIVEALSSLSIDNSDVTAKPNTKGSMTYWIIGIIALSIIGLLMIIIKK